MKSILKIFIVLLAMLVPVFAADEASALPVNKCARIVKSNVGSETLINRCNTCMKIKVERKRPSNAGVVPTMRDYTMPSGSNQPMPFKGPGGTRIVSESACRG